MKGDNTPKKIMGFGWDFFLVGSFCSFLDDDDVSQSDNFFTPHGSIENQKSGRKKE